MVTESLNIIEHFPLGRDAWCLRFDRPTWTWKAGQLVSLGGENPLDQRDYSIASGEEDPFLDVLYREIPHGIVTPHLRKQRKGMSIPVQGPYGRFTLRRPENPVVFCATGTGIAPCRAFMRTYPELQLTLLHGVRFKADLYYREEMEGIHYLPFSSKEEVNGKSGRLTDHLREMDLPPNASYYLCGANEMIYEAEDILKQRKISPDQIYHEPYYYRAYDEG